MLKRTPRALMLVSACLVVAFCSGETGGPAGESVRQFYEHLNDGNHAEAQALYSVDVRGVLDDPETGSSDGFQAWARSETKNGTVSRVEIVSVETEESGAVAIGFELHYDDGSSKNGSVTVSEEDGGWKLGLIH